MKDEIIQISKELFEKISHLDDTIDNYFEDVKDLTDTASDLLKPIQGFKKLYDRVRIIKFRRFLRAYASQLENSFDSPDDLTSKMAIYLGSEKNLSFVYETIDSALNTKSVICSGILGYLAGQILSRQLEPNMYDIIYINALRNLNDFELKSTIEILDNTKDWSQNQTVSTNTYFSKNVESYEYTVQRLKGLLIVRETIGGTAGSISLGQSFWGTYKLNKISEGFLKLIKESGYYQKIYA